jgi:hypothetical protein
MFLVHPEYIVTLWLEKGVLWQSALVSLRVGEIVRD